MTEEQIRALRQFCFQQASMHMQWNGRVESTNPTMDQIKTEADKLYDWIAGTQI